MFHIKNYRFGFDIWGLLLFLAIMCPNFIWFAVPAPNDILRSESVTQTVDMAAQISQVIMVASLCVLINISHRKPMNRKFSVAVAMFCALYFLGWIFYYTGAVNGVVILDLCAAPCMAFLLFSGARKNMVALVFAGIFMVCHLIYGMVNYIL